MKNKVTGYIYLLEVIEPRSIFYGYKYVGKHLSSNLKSYFSGGVIVNRIKNKYGIEAFNRKIIVNNILNENLLNELEKHYIRVYNTYKYTSKKGLNLTLGGDGSLGSVISDEHKLKISLKNKGRKVSQETKNKLSIFNKSNLNNKFIYSQLNRKRPDSEKLQISKTMKGKDVSIQCRIACVNKLKKPILQYDLEENFIKEWDSARTVSLTLNIKWKNISSNLRGKSKSSGGFIWKYK